MSLPKFIKEHGLLTIGLSFLAGAVVMFAGMYYFITHAIPDVRSSLQVLASEVRAARRESKEDVDRQAVALNKHIEEERADRARRDASMRVLQSHLIAVMQKVEKRPLRSGEIKQILSGVAEVSAVTAASLSAPVVVSGPTVPQVSKSIQQWIAAANVSREAAAQLQIMSTTNGLGVSGFLTRGLLAKDGVWRSTGKALSLKYAGGEATFAAKEGVTSATLSQYAETLNSMARAVSQTAKQDVSFRSPEPRGASIPKLDRPTPLPSTQGPDSGVRELPFR
jgi:hypothetical protein